MSVIKYDRPVADFIARLNATGHVTHKSYKKSSVTLHHNGGRLSHAGVLSVWQTRPASAHFDVDAKGAVAQFVDAHEYAWAVGNTEGNVRSISIEMANSTLAPDWEVAEATWKSAARLAGWLFAHEVDGTPRPSKDNLFVHHHWSSTACAGPFVDAHYDEILAEAQSAYDQFTASTGASSSAPAATSSDKKSNEEIAAEVWAGDWGQGTDRQARLRAAGYNPLTIQDLVNRGVGRTGGRHVAEAPARKSNEEIASEVWAGKWGSGDDRVRRLADAGYNPNVIQVLVNRGVGRNPNSKTPPTPAAVRQIAQQVINGQWGNGPERVRRLRLSGFDAEQIQAEVNRQLR